MDAVEMARGTWFSELRSRWRESQPHCEGADCSWAERSSRRLHWWNRPIRMRGEVFCAPQCFERAARHSFHRLLLAPTPEATVRHRLPLGLLMLSRGQLTQPQLRHALDAQHSGPQLRLGEWLEKLGFATEQEVTAALALQWACPVLADGAKPDLDCARILPWRLLQHFRMLPLQFVEATRTFYFAFCNRIEYAMLYAVEQMLACRALPCLAGHSLIDAALEQIAAEAGRRDLLFEGWRDAAEMARITTGYVLRLDMNEVTMTGCGNYIWVRLGQGRDGVNLLFSRSSAQTEMPDLVLQPITG